MVLVAVAHGVQPFILAWKPKLFVAISGAILYSTCAAGLFRRARWALWIAVGGPMVGFTTVWIGGLLAYLGVIGIKIAPDLYTVIGAVFQVPALFIAVRLLRAPLAQPVVKEKEPCRS